MNGQQAQLKDDQQLEKLCPCFCEKQPSSSLQGTNPFKMAKQPAQELERFLRMAAVKIANIIITSKDITALLLSVLP